MADERSGEDWCMCGRQRLDHYGLLTGEHAGLEFCRKGGDYLFVAMPEPFCSNASLRKDWVTLVDALWKAKLEPMKVMRAIMAAAETWAGPRG